MRLPLSRRRRVSRRGAVLIVVLICLLAITLLAATLLKLAVAQQRQLRLQERQLQAEWLATAALDRAEEMWAADPDWRPDTWTLPDDVLGEPAAATVMRVEAAEASSPVELIAQATVGPASGPPVRVTLRRRSSSTTGGVP